MSRRVTAAQAGPVLTITGGRITATRGRDRRLAGDLVVYGEVGQTNVGPLRVLSSAALQFPDNLAEVILTREHDRGASRGVLAGLEYRDDRIIASVRPGDGPDGDAAVLEAIDGTRAAFSYDVTDAVVEGDVLVSGRVVAIGQVGIPAYPSSRITHIAASHNPEGTTMNLRARLAALRANTARTAAEEAELTQLAGLETTNPSALDAAYTPPAQPAAPAAPAPAAPAAAPAPTPASPAAVEAPAAAPSSGPAPQQTGQQVAASLPAVPAGVPVGGGGPARRRGSLNELLEAMAAAASSRNVTAALTDITHAQVSADIDPPGWTGELWSGLAYTPKFTPLLNAGTLTDYEGKGWRWVTKPEVADYAGDKAAIPSAAVDTEPSSYTAARMATGNDFDRKFIDFDTPGAQAFLRGWLEACRESWAKKLDAKVRAWIVANAVAAGVGTTQPTILKAIAKAVEVLDARDVGNATFVVVNSADFFTLMDVGALDVPAYLELFGVKPEMIVRSAAVAAGTVLAGVKQTATVRTLPGSPIVVDAQHIANGGFDKAVFGYWAIEEHHTSGIVSVGYDPEP